MINSAAAILLFWLLASPSIAHLKYQRPVQVAGAGQHYIAVDETVWEHARPDLGDLRLMSDNEVPYALLTESGALEHERQQLQVLQQSTVGGKTQFLIDMSGLTEYDHVELTLATKNFIAHAHVEGSDDPHGSKWASLSDSILYDLSKENLGGNSTLRLPRTTYKYLRVNIDGAVTPQDVQGAVSEMAERYPAVWHEVSSSAKQGQNGRDTVFTFTVPQNVPVDRIAFTVDGTQGNFRREVEIRGEKDAELGSGQIARIHMVRLGRKIDSDVSEVSFSGTGHKQVQVLVHNGDDRPLKIASARLQHLEHRIYFDAPPQGSITLYYGDEKLGPPTYDYAKLFQRDKGATPAQLGAQLTNASFVAREDDRPWSDRHPVVLWVAIIAAVLGLGAVALRSMKTATAT